MRDERWAPAYCLLPGGKSALVAGGYSFTAGACVSTSDVFDEHTGRFAPCRSRLTYPRDFALAVPVNDAILIMGGYNTILGSLRTAELYDPKMGAFSLLKSQLSCGRELFTATTLPDGRVLCAGGFDTHRHKTQASADIFDPAMQAFSPVPSALNTDRFGHAAALLKDGRVLIVGGQQWTVGHPSVPLASAEVYDPRTNTFSRTGDLSYARDRPTATLLNDGTVLIAGGQNGDAGPRVCELFHPDTGKFTLLPAQLTEPRMAHSDATLPDGRVLLAGGWGTAAHATLPSTEVFDPRTGAFSPGPPMPQGGAHDLALVAFPDGLLLAAGGKQVQDGREGSLSQGAVLLP